jgi:vacuolar-type H+-ATPase subunit F/Vma7
MIPVYYNGMHKTILNYKPINQSMFLYNLQRITRDIKIKDETKKEMEALKVFQFAIQYLKEHLYKSISDKIKGIQEHDLHYVLTVPAIWEDSAKQFMREAATKVCNLILSLILHCKNK